MGVKEQTVEQIIEAIGGKDNIAAATHCVTRLRFALKSEDKVNKTMLENVDVVKGCFSTNGQFQVVIGQGLVNKVYDELVKITGIESASKEDIKNAAEKNLNPLQRAIKTLGDIFIPILPAIVTAGLLMGINNVLTGKGIFYGDLSVVEVHKQWKDVADIINLIANTSFTFLPGLIGWSAVKKFGGSPLLGIILGLMLVHPALLNAWGYGEAIAKGTVPYWNLFGLKVAKVGYQGQVLPVLASAYVLSNIEAALNKRVPDAFKLLIVAPVTLLITGFLSFIAIGPVTFTIANVITSGFVTIFNKFSLLGGLIFGALYAPLVITGMHHTFLAVDLQLITNIGGTFIWPMVALSNIAQGSASLAMMFVSKDEKVKGLSVTSAISAYLGITEPALFGVNIRFKFPFIAAITGSAIAAMFIAINKVKATSIGIGGLLGFLSIFPKNWGVFFISMVITIVIPFILTIILSKTKKFN
ncbi:PTS system trehalose-specific EIIBC component [Clostridium polyendosporum]|uniref:PTS system trehalose-specific EIIBC component n=1 Tax=Clostridium polyendosporum TaxID=69208 RepID=A0A919VGK8_9CLOT|nr:PTS system trehalose-specific EIIBC component [Clostridium polyendosporum]GIM29282.1 PTS system trehalose-specific EIIBC component [Clostridium polyendosporum]